jgi:hypothetical protein
MDKGTIFGERALLGRCTRAARIVTDTPCRFIELSQYIFGKLVEKFFHRRKLLNNEYFTGLGIFRTWTTSRMF